METPRVSWESAVCRVELAMLSLYEEGATRRVSRVKSTFQMTKGWSGQRCTWAMTLFRTVALSKAQLCTNVKRYCICSHFNEEDCSLGCFDLNSHDQNKPSQFFLLNTEMEDFFPKHLQDRQSTLTIRGCMLELQLILNSISFRSLSSLREVKN